MIPVARAPFPAATVDIAFWGRFAPGALMAVSHRVVSAWRDSARPGGGDGALGEGVASGAYASGVRAAGEHVCDVRVWEEYFVSPHLIFVMLC